MIKMIWAMDESCLIGANNKMPWHLKEDLIYYKNMTKDYPVIMGYNTYRSLEGYYKGKGFPYKKTYVLTQTKIEDDRIESVTNLNDFLKNLDFDLFVVGGKNVYMQFMPYADELYVTYVNGVHEGDTYMEPIDLNKFELVSSKEAECKKAKFTVYRKK